MLLGHFRTSSNVSITSSVVWFQVDNVDRVYVVIYFLNVANANQINWHFATFPSVSMYAQFL